MARRFAVLFVLLGFIVAFDISAAGRRRASGPDEVTGVITAISSNSITVQTQRGSFTAALTAATRVTREGVPVGLDALAIGIEVEIHVQNVSGVATAVAIEIESEDESSGIIVAVSAAELVIETRAGNVTFLITTDTRVLVDGQRAAPADLRVGMMVEVESVRGSNGTRRALVIIVRTSLVEIEGVVTAITAQSLTVRNAAGQLITIAITPDTRVRSRSDVVNITVGALVRVRASRDAAGALTAVSIEVQFGNRLVELKGTITAVAPNSISVRTIAGNDITVAITADTFVRRHDRTAGTIADLTVGTVVEIKARTDGTTLTALLIEIDDDDDHFAEIRGPITSVAGSAFTVSSGSRELTFTITSATLFERGTAADIRVGAIVEVVGRRNPDGSLIAVRVEFEDGGDDNGGANEVEVRGVISASSGTSITVRSAVTEYVFAIDANTEITEDNRPRTAADLVPGLPVEVKGVRRADGSLLARRIEIED